MLTTYREQALYYRTNRSRLALPGDPDPGRSGTLPGSGCHPASPGAESAERGRVKGRVKGRVASRGQPRRIGAPGTGPGASEQV